MYLKIFLKMRYRLGYSVFLFFSFVYGVNLNWEKISDGSPPKNAWFETTVFNNSMLIVTGLGPKATEGCEKIYQSSNGKDWSVLCDKVPFPQRHHFGVVSMGEYVYVFDGTLAN